MNRPPGAGETHTEFHRRYNISHLEPDLPPATVRQVLHHCLASALVYGAVLLFITYNPYFRDLLGIRFHGISAAQLYGYGYVLYLVLTPLVCFVLRPPSLRASKNLMIVRYLGRLFHRCLNGGTAGAARDVRPSYEEKHALAFLLIKMLYGPLMVNSALLEYNAWPNLLREFHRDASFLNVCDLGYLLLVSGVFFLDSLLFIIGYHTEAGLLKNRLRYAETNLWHILVCVACYPPFNTATIAFLGPSNQNVYITINGSVTHPLTWVLRALAMIFLLLLLSSSASLFTKASNLTNRGIVQHGPYRFIRHPGYLAKNLFWLMTLLPAFIPNKANPHYTLWNYLIYCAVITWGMIGWGTIYFLRALTEEAFLMKDPDYVAYCQKVKYRFIPGVY